MRHKIEMSGNIGFLNKNLIQKNPDDIFYLSFIRSHPKVQTRYEQESISFNNLLEESRKLQLKLLMELEEFIMIEYDYKSTNRVSMLDCKWSNIVNKKLRNKNKSKNKIILCNLCKYPLCIECSTMTISRSKKDEEYTKYINYCNDCIKFDKL